MSVPSERELVWVQDLMELCEHPLILQVVWVEVAYDLGSFSILVQEVLMTEETADQKPRVSPAGRQGLFWTCPGQAPASCPSDVVVDLGIMSDREAGTPFRLVRGIVEHASAVIRCR